MLAIEYIISLFWCISLYLGHYLIGFWGSSLTTTVLVCYSSAVTFYHRIHNACRVIYYLAPNEMQFKLFINAGMIVTH